MSLESKIEALTQAVIALTAKLESSTVAPPALTVNPIPAAPTVAAPAPTTVTVAAASNTVAVSGTPVGMPPPPSFQAPAPAVASVGAPFSDPKGLIDYVMTSYKALGPQKGAEIQKVLTGLGYGNINDVKPEHYGQLFAGVEALKG